MKRLIYLVIFLLSISMVEAKVVPVDIDIGTEFVTDLEHVQGTVAEVYVINLQPKSSQESIRSETVLTSGFLFVHKTNKTTREGIRPPRCKKTSNKSSNIGETQYYKSYLRMDLEVNS